MSFMEHSVIEILPVSHDLSLGGSGAEQELLLVGPFSARQKSGPGWLIGV